MTAVRLITITGDDGASRVVLHPDHIVSVRSTLSGLEVQLVAGPVHVFTGAISVQWFEEVWQASLEGRLLPPPKDPT